VVEKSFGTSE